MQENNIFHILTVNAGSSSIKLAIYEFDNMPRQIMECMVTNIGLSKSEFIINAHSLASE